MMGSPGQARGRGTVLALSGGVGGAKLVQGLAAVLEPEDLIVAANTGDDFEHMGLSISPDLDTIMYTLADIHNEELGWGQRGETWQFMQGLGRLGADTWFQLGDRDLATHVLRTQRLGAGETLSAVTAALCRKLDIRVRLIPMSDDRVRTHVSTDVGLLEFQNYFVRLQCAPKVSAISFHGVSQANPQPLLMDALRHKNLRAVVICPSNPFISIEPILAVPGIREALTACAAPVIAVAPIVGGQAIKGPTVKMMAELGIEPGIDALLDRYEGMIDAMFVDIGDADVRRRGLSIVPAQIIMRTLDDKKALAQRVLDLADAMAGNISVKAVL
jgi:LPPG:FO 2-phospho-L-lactate transferase